MMAERNKRAQILEAEGLKQAQVLEAEGRQEAAFRDAEARERSAEAEARATQVVSEAIAKGDVQAINYFVAQKYTEALAKIGSATNSKIVLMPIEASSLIGSLGGIGEIAKEVFRDEGTAGAQRQRGAPAASSGPTRAERRRDEPCWNASSANSAPGTGWFWASCCWRWKSWCRASSCCGSASPRCRRRDVAGALGRRLLDLGGPGRGLPGAVAGLAPMPASGS